MQPLPSEDPSQPSPEHQLSFLVPYARQTSIESNPPRIGNCYAYWYNDKDFKLFIGLNIFIFFFSLVVLIAAAIKGRTLSLVGGLILLFIQSSVYCWAAFKNPGLPSRAASRAKYQIYQGDYVPRKYFCTACQLFKEDEQKTYHCYTCGICIEGYDHHCPWTTKCIGRGNQCLFYMFVGTSMAYMVFVMINIVFIWSDVLF